MKMVPLGEIAEIISGATPKTGVDKYWGGDVQWATPADLSTLHGAYISSTSRTLTDQGVRSCATSVLPADSVLLSSRAPIGYVAINTVPMATNQGFKSLVLGPDIDAKYLYHWLKSVTIYLQSLGNGATFKELSKRTVERVELPLPSLQEQRRIVALLDKADSIRAKHREVVDHLDALTQSIFHDMFGDPTKASHSVPLAQVADLVGGRNLVADDQTAQSKYRVLKISSVTRGVFDPLESKALPLDYNPPKKHFVQRGDLLMSRANTAELVGATALVDIDVHRLVLPDKIWRFEWHDPESSPVFYQALLQTPEIRSIISRLSSGTGGSMKNISKQKLARIELPDISIDKQHEFSESVSRVRETGRVMMESGDELNALFTSLQSRAFKGEL